MSKIIQNTSAIQIFSTETKRLLVFLLNALLALSFHPGFSQGHRHSIPPVKVDTSTLRPGFYLIMDENFDGPLDEKRWDKSGPGDENHGCMKNYRHVEDHVFTRDGKLFIEISKNRGDGCAYLGGEIKTFEYKEGSTYRNYWLFPGSYLEVKARIPMGYGVASAGWLYSFQVNEIDMWEYWDEQQDRYQINYHWGSSYKDSQYDSDPYEVKARNLSGDPLPLHEKFLTFGLEWDSSYIKHYLNGTLIKTYYLDQETSPRKARPYHPKTPAFLRFNTAPAMRSPEIYLPDSLQKYLILDHVRLYRKTGEWALPEMQVEDTLQKHSYGGGGNISVAYHPDASYRWYAPDFQLSENSDPKCMCERIWLAFGPELKPQRSYPVFLSVEFPTGHKEIRVWNVYIKE